MTRAGKSPALATPEVSRVSRSGARSRSCLRLSSTRAQEPCRKVVLGDLANRMARNSFWPGPGL